MTDSKPEYREHILTLKANFKDFCNKHCEFSERNWTNLGDFKSAFATYLYNIYRHSEHHVDPELSALEDADAIDGIILLKQSGFLGLSLGLGSATRKINQCIIGVAVKSFPNSFIQDEPKL